VTPISRPNPRRRRPRRAARALVPAVLLAIAAAVGPAVAASAHDSIIATTPADGAHVDAAPAQVSMVYTDSLIGVGAAVAVVDRDGTDWADGPVTLTGPDAVQPLRAGMPDGTYEVRWRVVSGDGHPIAGAYGFTVGDADAAATADDATRGDAAGRGDAAAAADAAATAPRSEPTAATGSASSAPVGDDTADGSAGSTAGIGALGALVGVGAYVAVIRYRGRRRTT
jgi:methionine-rich copper-binding protein CopC